MEYLKEDELLCYEELCETETRKAELIDKKELFQRNIRLVPYVMSKYNISKDPAITYEDMVQECYLSLWKACLRYDESKGKFSTYAILTIEGYLLTYLRDSGSIKLPRIWQDIRSTILAHGFETPLSSEDVDTIVSEGKFTREQVLDYVHVSVKSLNELVAGGPDDDPLSLQDMLPDDSIDVTDTYTEENITRIVTIISSFVKPIHREMVEEWLYSEMLDEETITQEEIAKKYGICQATVSRAFKAARIALEENRREIEQILGVESNE